jgi:DNA-binding XRE family transcriptional regulator
MSNCNIDEYFGEGGKGKILEDGIVQPWAMVEGCKEFRALRKLRGLTLKQVSASTGISFQTIGGIERGDRNPSISALQTLCNFYQVDFILRCESKLTKV